ncbi:hypothetical protein Tco_1280062 [Tanacetum coccineum]
MEGALLSDTVKNLKLNTSLVLSARSCLIKDPQGSTHIHGSIKTITIHPKQQSDSHDGKPKENKGEEKNNREDINTNPSTPPDPSVSFITKKVLKLNSFYESLGLVPQLSGIEFVYNKGNDGDVMFIEIVKNNDDSQKEEPKAGGLEVGCAFWSLNEDILKITILKTNTPYQSRRYGVSVPALTKDHRRININTSYPEDSIRRIQDMESIYYSRRYQAWSLLQEIPNTPSQLLVNLKNEEITEGIIRNYYDREDGETTSRFEV